MKTIILTTLILLLSANSEAQTVVSGKWNRRGTNGELTLYRVLPGRVEKIDAVQLNEDRKFSFEFTSSEESFYIVGTGGASTKMQKYVFYLKPDDKLNFEVNETTYRLVGENTAENVALADWHKHILPIEREAIYPQVRQTYMDFFPLIEEKSKSIGTSIAGNTPTGNPTFDNIFADFQKFDLIYYALNFLRMGRGINPENSDFPDFYRNLSIGELTATTSIMIYPYDLLPGVAHTENRLYGGIDGRNLIAHVKNDTVKGQVFLDDLTRVKDVVVMNEQIELYGAYILTNDQKERFENEKRRIIGSQALSNVGTPGHNFTYKDVNGNDVSFSDFKGKVMYVDVWATWCAPCRAELPHLKKVKEHFADNKNVVIVGISTDAPRDIQKWKDFGAKEELGGVQLHGNIEGDGNISRLYNISGIPRFLIFDKQGNIVSVEAPRPSSAEIIPLLTRLSR
jgi:thiol-disulfide isomerase/thioredoxin